MYFVEPALTKPKLLPREAYRLETWYAHNGWFDARFIGWQMRRVRDVGPNRAGIIDIHGYIDPGEPSLVRKLEVRGLDGTLKLLGSTAVREGYLKEESQYSLEYAESLRQEILHKLRNHSRAYAEVSIQSTAYPEDHVVDVTLLAEPGIGTRYGKITVTGNDKVRTSVIESAIPFEMGQTYKYKDLALAQQRLFSLSTFSIVNVEPDLSDPTQKRVPIHVSVTESKFRTLRMGVGGDIDTTQLQPSQTLLDLGGMSPRATIEFQHVNLLNQLIRFEADATAGFDFVYDDVQDDNVFKETWSLRSSLTYPRIAGQRVALDLEGQLVQDVQSGLWAFLRKEANTHVVWNAFNDVQVRAGPYVEQYTYLFTGTAQSDAARRFFGDSLQVGAHNDKPTYSLTALDEFLIVDLRDDKFDTSRGAYYSGHLRQAYPLLDKGTTYISGAWDGRWYKPIRVNRKHRDFPFVVAGAFRGEYLLPLGKKEIPYPERVFMGGATSIRGFRQDAVGPYDTLCTYDLTKKFKSQNADILEDARFSEFTIRPAEPAAPFHLPHGGTLALQTSAEIRYQWINGITLATFGDAGMLTESLADLDMDKLRLSAGVGGRYKSPIGPIRMDISFRRLYPEDFGPNLFVNCLSEDDEHGRVDDLYSSAFPASRGTLERPPFATVFFIAIGESI
jgi:outer membrane protein insertion porin family/translocation and assembly module TamA